MIKFLLLIAIVFAVIWILRREGLPLPSRPGAPLSRARS